MIRHAVCKTRADVFNLQNVDQEFRKLEEAVAQLRHLAQARRVTCKEFGIKNPHHRRAGARGDTM